MTADRWERMKRLFAEAVLLPAEQRTDFLRRECDDEEMRVELEEMLRAHEAERHLLRTPGEAAGTGSPEGRRLGEFELVEVLGRGGMGVVYRARDRAGNDVALKQLHPGLALSSLHRERFEREAHTAARLDHPGIVRVLDEGEDDGVLFFVMEFIAGRSLDELVVEARESAPTETREDRADRLRRWVRLVADIADTLHYAHEHGVIHRDVKPQNVLVDDEGRPHLIDFGLAKFEALRSLTISGDIAGTPYYMSPEQALAKRVKVDRRADVFSLGVVLYEMLTLRRPFEGDTQQDVLYSITFRDPASMRSVDRTIPRDLDTICFKAMEKRPADRYATAADLAADLRRHLDGKPVLAQSPSLVGRARRRLRPHRRKVLFGGVAAGALVLGSGATLGGARWFARRHWPRLSVAAADGRDGDALRLLSIDPLGRVEDVQGLGRAPVESIAVRPGWYRVVLLRDGVTAAERFVHLEERRSVELRLRASAEPPEGMVRIPAGSFRFGDPGAPEGSYYDERAIQLPAFLIDAVEVSNAEYRRFVRDTGQEPPRFWNDGYDPAWDDRPVVDVSWFDAQAYAAWAGKRLPAVAEWERAARGEDGRLYPWGNDRSRVADEAVLRGPLPPPPSAPIPAAWRRRRYLDHVQPVTALGTGPHGLRHALGNVAEWTESPFVRERGRPPQTQNRLVKGGSFCSPAVVHLAAYRPQTPSWALLDTGFRCARSV